MLANRIPFIRDAGPYLAEPLHRRVRLLGRAILVRNGLVYEQGDGGHGLVPEGEKRHDVGRNSVVTAREGLSRESGLIVFDNASSLKRRLAVQLAELSYDSAKSSLGDLLTKYEVGWMARAGRCRLHVLCKGQVSDQRIELHPTICGAARLLRTKYLLSLGLLRRTALQSASFRRTRDRDTSKASKSGIMMKCSRRVDSTGNWSHKWILANSASTMAQPE